jgi:hypothetical protein
MTGGAEAKYAILFLQSRYAQINLPAMRGQKVMMMGVRIQNVHIGRQYTKVGQNLQVDGTKISKMW